MRIFLRMKSWQLFVILIGIPFLIEFIMIGLIIFSRNGLIFFSLYPLLMALFVGPFFGWLYALGANLYKRLPATEKMNLTTFKIFLFFPAIYMLLFFGFLFVYFPTIVSERGQTLIPLIFAGIFPLHLFAMFCIFYGFYFISKTLKAVEWQRPVTVGDYIGEFLLLWFYPVGVWFIQPRINKLFIDSDGFDA